MDSAGRLFIKNYLSNMQVDITLAGYTKCFMDWRDIDYTPAYNKFYLIYSGEGWLRIGGRDYYPEPGQLFLMPRGVKQSYGAISENTFLKHWCHFTASIGEMNLFDLIKTPYFINVENLPLLKELFASLLENCSGSGMTSVLRAKASIYSIIAYFLESCGAEPARSLDSPAAEKLDAVLAYIENHLSGDITVEELARTVYLHPNYFIRFFKKHLGCSPMHYIKSLRLERARTLLTGSAMSVKEIALATGFKDLFHFSKSIKSYTGFSPSELRRTR